MHIKSNSFLACFLCSLNSALTIKCIFVTIECVHFVLSKLQSYNTMVKLTTGCKEGGEISISTSERRRNVEMTLILSNDSDF